MPARPVDLVEVLRASTRIVTANAPVMLGVAALLVGIPTAILAGLSVLLELASPELLRVLLTFDPESADAIERVATAALTWSLWLLLLLLVVSVAYVVAQVALTRATLDACAGRPVTLRTSFAAPARTYFSMLIASTTVWSLVSVGFACCCVLPALPLAAAFLFTSTLVVDRGANAVTALIDGVALARTRPAESALVALGLGVSGLCLYALHTVASTPLFGILERAGTAHAGDVGAAMTPAVLATSAVIIGAQASIAILLTVAFQVVPTVLYVHVREAASLEDVARTFA